VLTSKLTDGASYEFSPGPVRRGSPEWLVSGVRPFGNEGALFEAAACTLRRTEETALTSKLIDGASYELSPGSERLRRSSSESGEGFALVSLWFKTSSTKLQSSSSNSFVSFFGSHPCSSYFPASTSIVSFAYLRHAADCGLHACDGLVVSEGIVCPWTRPSLEGCMPSVSSVVVLRVL
jgi:hypothetical protein